MALTKLNPFTRPLDMAGVTILYQADNGTAKYRLQDGQHRREFTIEHAYAGERRRVGCSGISRFVTAFEAQRGPFSEGERSWVWLAREDGWITRSHARTLRKVLAAARQDIAAERTRQELEAAGCDARLHHHATAD